MGKPDDLIFVKQYDHSRIAYMRTSHDASQTDAISVLYLGGLNSSMAGTKASLLHNFASQNSLNFYRFDYRGHGSSDGIFTDFGVDHWVEDAALMLDKAIYGKVILVGSSMGAWIGAALAKQRADRIAGFIGIACAPDFTQREFMEKLTDTELAIIDAGGIAQIASDYDEPYQISRAILEGGRRMEVLNEALVMNFPVRLFHGMNDKSVDYNLAIELAEHITSPDLHLNLIKDANHGFSRNQDMAFIYEAVLSLLKRKA